MKITRLPLLLLVAMMTLSFGLEAYAQPGGGRGQRQRWEDMTEEERAEFQEQMRQRQAEREAQQAEQLRERLEISEEDFEVIGPMIAKVQTLVRERQTVNGGRGFAGNRGNRGNRGGGAFALELSEPAQAVSEAMTELQEAIEDDNSGDMKSALTDLRQARTALDAAVKTAQDELRSVCTTKWEAEFVVMGLLD